MAKMTAQQTTDHMMRHYRRSLEELADEGLTPDIKGLVAFNHSVAMSLVGQRADLVGMAWVQVLQSDVNLLLQLGHDMFGCPHGGHDHGPGDDE